MTRTATRRRLPATAAECSFGLSARAAHASLGRTTSTGQNASCVTCSDTLPHNKTLSLYLGRRTTTITSAPHVEAASTMADATIGRGASTTTPSATTPRSRT